jgi:hypothetical protein
MKVEVGQRYIFDGQIVIIVYVCEQYANNMYPYSQTYKRYQVTGINQCGHKRYFTYTGIHVYLTESNFIGYQKQSYPSRIVKYIHSIFKRTMRNLTDRLES